MKFVKWNLMTIFAFMFSIKLSTAIFCMKRLAYASFKPQSFILQLKKYAKYNRKLLLSIYHSSLKILNLHRKSKYQQNKNIARFLKHKLRALCSYFNDIWIFYANLKFSVSSYWKQSLFYSLFSLIRIEYFSIFLHFCPLPVTDEFPHVSLQFKVQRNKHKHWPKQK